MGSRQGHAASASPPVRRGDVVIAEAPGDLTTKPRPYVVVQTRHSVGKTALVTVCPLTARLTHTDLVRVAIEPTSENGLSLPSEVAADLVVTLRVHRIKDHVGALELEAMNRVDQALRRHLDL